MFDEKISKIALLKSLPMEWQEDLLPKIILEIKESNRKVVILDDDPTGTQTIHNLPVLTNWSVEILTEELNGNGAAFFILTNSRSLDQIAACNLAHKIGLNLKKAAEQSGVEPIVLSRSDSTLRGHFPQEVDAFAAATGTSDLPYLVMPFFLEGGRFTAYNYHFVEETGELIPAAKTSYAEDASFGFFSSNLCEWIEEKTSAKIPMDNVITITLDEIRTGGPDVICKKLSQVPLKSACIVNAMTYRDVEVFVYGLLKAEKKGKRFLYRTAASFVRVRSGVIPKGKLLIKKELISTSNNGGLFVIGSYVPKTSSQLQALTERGSVNPIEINVKRLLQSTAERNDEITEIVARAGESIKAGEDTVIYTSRELVKGNDAKSSLKIGQKISDSILEILRKLKHQPKYLVAKGGITSSDIATKVLNVRRAIVMGQVMPGVPVWQLGKETLYPGMPYIIFPGNVGDNLALVTMQKKLN